MAVDESSSQDSTLIDDDLVAALGFKPVTTIEAPTEDDASNGDTASDKDADDSVSDDVDVDDVDVDDVAPDGDINANSDLNGFGIDQVDEAAMDADLLVGNARVGESDDPADVDDISAEPVTDLEVDELEIDDRASFFDLPGSTDEVSTDEVSTDEVSTDEDEIEVGDVPADDELGGLVDDEQVESDLDAVPSIADPELDADATAPVGLIDLDSSDLDSSDLDSGDLDGDHADPDDTDAAAVIDLEVVDLSDASVDEVSTQGFAEADVQELADADSVFADAIPVLDSPVFDDQGGHNATETIGRVEPGMLDLDVDVDLEEETVAAATAESSVHLVKRGRRVRARKSRRVIRHIDPWSVLTFSVLFHMVVFAALLLSSVLVWNAAIASGMVENVESFIQELGDYETFEINADVMFRAAIVIAGMLTLASSVLVVLLTVVFNLISDLVGGIRVTVIEEETVRVPIDKKRSKARNE